VSRTELFGFATLLSVLLFVGSLVLIPWFVARIPADYFRGDGPPSRAGRGRSAGVLRVLRNALGVALLAIGVAMLVLPGQGLLTIAMSILLLDIPGKRRLARKIVRRPPVLRALNALRRRSGHPPLILD
jgi:Putative transmembrane protein (PGPGW)